MPNERPKETEPWRSTPKIPVLVVDDSSMMIRIIRDLLQQIGFSDIDHALDGGTALEKMRVKRYGLVISDWNMQPKTGFTLLRCVREDPATQLTPFIMMTAEAKVEYALAAKKAGVDDYIVKPFTAQTLKAKIEDVLAAKVALTSSGRG
jgi:two-component system, chemotaxis family, chemotaxis protein CheY